MLHSLSNPTQPRHQLRRLLPRQARRLVRRHRSRQPYHPRPIPSLEPRRRLNLLRPLGKRLRLRLHHRRRPTSPNHHHHHLGRQRRDNPRPNPSRHGPQLQQVPLCRLRPNLRGHRLSLLHLHR